MLSRLSALLDFEAIRVDPYGDSVGEDPPGVAAVGETTERFRGAVSSLKVEGAGELRSILTPTDIRERLESPPDESIWVRMVSRAGEPIDGQLWSTLVASPQPAAELAMRSGIGLTVLHTAKGAANA